MNCSLQDIEERYEYILEDYKQYHTKSTNLTV